MAYACPVCDTEQADGVHLANHLAVTASLGREDHLEFLETHVPGWADCTPEELAAKVREYAPEIDVPEFDESEGGATFEDELARQTSGAGRGDLTGGPTTEETERVLEEARELTRRMHEEGDGADGDEND
ncbi:DUF5810 domain-containing protein [Natrialbaceae archaeon A-gly3]